MKTLKLIFSGPFWVLFLFACTIIKDEDIASEAELSQLKLKGLEILQETSKGSSSTVTTLLYDSVVNVTDDLTGAKLTRRLRFRLPALGSLKMKLKSGLNSTTEVQVYYMDDGQPYTVRIFLGDSSVEQYRFRYDTYTGTRKLNRFITILNPIDNLPPTYTCVDQLNYTGTSVTSITRTPTPGSPSTFNINYEGSGPNLGVNSFTAQGVQYQRQQGNCPGESTFESCTGYGVIANGGSTYTIQFSQLSNFLGKVFIHDCKINCGGNSTSRDFDTYIFHPLMFLRNQVGQGKFLLVIYMMDWWQLGPSISNPNFTKNESVSINLKY